MKKWRKADGGNGFEGRVIESGMGRDEIKSEEIIVKMWEEN